MHTEKFLNEMKTLLSQRRATVEEELAGIRGHVELGSSLEDAASEEELDEVHTVIRERLENELEDIAAAENRIANGTYGVTTLGEKISEERLRAFPYALENVMHETE